MNITLLRFHHLGLAVRRPHKAFDFLASLGYREGRQVYDPLQSVNLAMRHHPAMPDVEVIWPGEAPSPVDKLVTGGKSLVYHICFATEDASRALAELTAAGHQIVEIAPPKPAILFDNLAVSFYNVLGFGMIELIHGIPDAHASMQPYSAGEARR
jgi:catechol 2,3-dioxygenase-like lactoylglutathione lyase family enzyme